MRNPAELSGVSKGAGRRASFRVGGSAIRLRAEPSRTVLPFKRFVAAVAQLSTEDTSQVHCSVISSLDSQCRRSFRADRTRHVLRPCCIAPRQADRNLAVFDNRADRGWIAAARPRTGELLVVGIVDLSVTVSLLFATAASPDGPALAETKVGALLSFAGVAIAIIPAMGLRRPVNDSQHTMRHVVRLGGSYRSQRTEAWWREVPRGPLRYGL